MLNHATYRPREALHQFIGIWMGFWSLMVTATELSTNWPDVPTPPQATRFTVMPQAELNGQMMRVQGFFSPQPPTVVADWYQAKAPGRWVKTTSNGMTLLGQWTAPYFTTIQLQTSGGGSKATVSTTLNTPPATSSSTAEHDRLLNHFPAETRVLQHLRTADTGQSSAYYLLEIPAGTASGINAARTWLTQKGYRLHTRSQDRDGTHMLQFIGKQEEAVVLAGKRPDQSTYLILTDIRRTP
jgi:hypothetical protein